MKKDFLNSLDIKDVHSYLLYCIKDIYSYRENDENIESELIGLMTKISPENNVNEELYFLAVYLEEVSLFDTINLTKEELEERLQEYFNGTLIKKDKLIYHIPRVIISTESKNSYSSLDNFNNEIARIYDNFKDLIEEIEKILKTDISDTKIVNENFFIRLNGKPAGLESNSGYLSQLSKLLNNEEHEYYKQFHEFLDVLSYGTINY